MTFGERLLFLSWTVSQHRHHKAIICFSVFVVLRDACLRVSQIPHIDSQKQVRSTGEYDKSGPYMMGNELRLSPSGLPLIGYAAI